MSKKYYLGVDDILPLYNTSFMDGVNCLEGIKVRINDREEYFPCDKYEVFYPEMCSEQAHDEAWVLVKKCFHMSKEDQLECFGFMHTMPIIENLDYQKAKAMYDAWVKKNTVKEMTVEEVSEALGYKVKIVSKEDK